MHGRSEGLGFDYPYLDIDNEAAFHDAARLLIQLGHRRVALVNDELTKTFAIHRERGARRALAASGLTLAPQYVFSAPMTEENGYRGAARACSSRPSRRRRSSAPRMIMALGIVRAARELGLDIPARPVADRP